VNTTSTKAVSNWTFRLWVGFMWNWAGNKFRQRGEFEILYTKEKHIGKNHSSMCVALSEKFWELVWYHDIVRY